MLQPFAQAKPPATSIEPKCPPHQQASCIYNGNTEEDFNGAHSPWPQQHSYQVDTESMRGPRGLQLRQNLQIASSNVPQPPIYSTFDQRSCVSSSHEFSKRSIPSFWNHRALKKGNSIISDEGAARQIEIWFLKRRKLQLTARIFRNLVIRRDELDDSALNDLLLAADKIIFGGTLSGRVRWEWSRGQPEYENELLGTTAVQHADPSTGGFKTVIVLSRPLLQDERFSRDLLLSAFLHELIHSYLFIHCGRDHAKDDGHTVGFRKIAKIIDTYFRQQRLRLHLCNMRANLDHFLVSKMPVTPHGSHSVNGQFWARNLSPKPERRYQSSADEGYYSGDRSPIAELPCNTGIDEGYGSRDTSPGCPGSSHYYVVVETGSESRPTENHCADSGLRFTTTHNVNHSAIC